MVIIQKDSEGYQKIQKRLEISINFQKDSNSLKEFRIKKIQKDSERCRGMIHKVSEVYGKILKIQRYRKVQKDFADFVRFRKNRKDIKRFGKLQKDSELVKFRKIQSDLDIL